MTTGDGTEPAGGRNSPEDFASRVFAFLSAIGGVSAEEERAHLIATQLSSVVPCAVAGVALVDDSGSWAITWQMKGQPLIPAPSSSSSSNRCASSLPNERPCSLLHAKAARRPWPSHRYSKRYGSVDSRSAA